MSDRVIDHRYAPPSVWTAICRPDDAAKTLVREDGALLYRFHAANGRPQWWFGRVIDFSLVGPRRAERVAQHTFDARVPEVVTVQTYRGATLTLRAFAHGGPGGGARYDIVIWEVAVDPGVDEALVGLHVDVHESGIAERDLAPWRAMRVVPEGDTGSAPLLVSVPDEVEPVASLGYLPARGLQTTLTLVSGGATLRGAIVVPLDGAPVDEVSLDWAERALAEEHHFWAGVFTDLVPIQVPDTAVQGMVEASVRNILQAREVVDGQLVYQVGSAVYRGLWMVDGHFLLEVAQYLHRGDDARRGLETMLSNAREDGYLGVMAYISLLKETGVGIAAVVRQWELTGDDDLLRAAWPVVRRGFDYIESIREEARALPPDHPAHGLTPPAFPDGGSAGIRPELTTALWSLHGMRAGLRAAAVVAPDDVPLLRERYESLFADLRRFMDRYRDHLDDGTPYVPIVLPGGSTHVNNRDVEPGVHERIVPQTSTWALAQAIWPGELFAPDDPVVTDYLRLLDRIDDEQGIPAGAGFLPFRSLWTYYASFAAHVWLYAGRPDKAVDYLYAYANHASTTRVWREEQSFVDNGIGHAFGDMPHNWASAEFVRLVRDLLVFELTDRLDLLAGLPAEWTGPGAVTSVAATPTRFGTVSLTVTGPPRPGEPGTIDVTLSGRRDLRRCVLHVPPGPWVVTVDGGTPDKVTGPTTMDLAS